MKPLLFLSRVAFLYNTCMLLAFLMKYVNVLPDGSVKSTVIVAGFALSVVTSVVANAWAGLVLAQRGGGTLKPAWLFRLNFGCFAFQIFLLLNNDPVHH